MHYLVIFNYGRSCKNKLSFLSTFIYGMTHCIPYNRGDLPFINEAWSVAL